MFAVHSTVEPPIVEIEHALLGEGAKPWAQLRLPGLKVSVRRYLGDLSRHPGQTDWLDGDFSAGYPVMVGVLRRIEADLLGEYPNLVAYVARGEARPAFQSAFAAQLAVFSGQTPTGS